MNILLFQMIAAHASSSNNPALTEILARINGSPSANPSPDPQHLLTQLGSGNPLLSALGKHFAEVQTITPSHTSAPIIDLESEPEQASTIDRSNATPNEEASFNPVNELREELKNVSAELKVL